LATRGSNRALSEAVKSSIELECGEAVPIPTCEKANVLAKIAKAVIIFFIMLISLKFKVPCFKLLLLLIYSFEIN
jgi:hypothetical protein